MHIAVSQGCTCLLKVGRESCVVGDEDGRIPLHYAASMGNIETLSVLLKAGGGNEIDSVPVTDDSGSTALHFAASSGNTAFLLEVCDNNAVFAKAKDGRTPLHCALSKRHTEALKVILQAGGMKAIRWYKNVRNRRQP